MEGLWVLVFSPCSGPSQLPYWSSVGVPAREACGRGSCYHHKGLCCGHRRSERDGWDSPGETSDGLCVYVWCLASETSTPHWSSFLGLISRPWGSNGSPIWALRVSSRTDSDSQGYSLLAQRSLKNVGIASSLCQQDVYGLRPGSVQGDLTAKAWLCSQGFIRIVLLSGGYTSLFPSSCLCFRWGWKASYALSCRSLKIYVDRSSHWRKSPQLLVCFGAGRRGLAISKHRISHWVNLMRCVAFVHLSAFGHILLGAWLPLNLFSEESS